MSRVCAICGKKRMLGNTVSHANNKHRREFRPNLVSVHAKIGGRSQRVRLCTRCLRTGCVEKA